MQSDIQNKKTLSADDLAQFIGTDGGTDMPSTGMFSTPKARNMSPSRAKRIGFWTKSL